MNRLEGASARDNRGSFHWSNNRLFGVRSRACSACFLAHARKLQKPHKPDGVTAASLQARPRWWRCVSVPQLQVGRSVMPLARAIVSILQAASWGAEIW